MTSEIHDLADRAWDGERVVDTYRESGRLFPVTDAVALVLGFGNVVAVRTAQGLLLVDTSQPAHIQAILESIGTWSDAPVDTVVYTHGHFDHVGGMPAIDDDADARGRPRPRVVAHANVPRRFARYSETSGYNSVINRRQFRGRAATAGDRQRWEQWRSPDVTYEDNFELVVGGVRATLHHGKGETDDHTWVHLPDHGIVCTGDFFTWVCPNAGNPQKVQRYPREWAQSLRAIVAAGPEILLPAHNMPLFGRARIAEALGDSASLLEHLVNATIALMNEGAALDEVLARVQAPSALLARPYLRPLYDEPEFIVRNIWRMYGGWYDGNPAHLKPAPPERLAAELAALAGSAVRVARRALELAAAGDSRTATELAEFAGRASPEDPEVHRLRAEVYRMRAAGESSLMARSIYQEAAETSEAVAGLAVGSP
jgi:alkyl sulfatase BDS1-like metallo-beta-lactamase superfamily hydrolase